MTTTQRGEQPSPPLDPIWTIEELAARWKIDTKTIRRYVREGRLPFLPISEASTRITRGPVQYRFRLEQILAFEQNETRYHKPPSTENAEVTRTKQVQAIPGHDGQRRIKVRSGRKK